MYTSLVVRMVVVAPRSNAVLRFFTTLPQGMGILQIIENVVVEPYHGHGKAYTQERAYARFLLEVGR